MSRIVEEDSGDGGAGARGRASRCVQRKLWSAGFFLSKFERAWILQQRADEVIE
jgi:hypothetical protein